MYNKYLARWQGPSRHTLPTTIQDAISAYFCIIDQTETVTAESPELSDVTLYCYDVSSTSPGTYSLQQEQQWPCLQLSLATPNPLNQSNLVGSCDFTHTSPFHSLAGMAEKLKQHRPTVQEQYEEMTPSQAFSGNSMAFIVTTLSYIEIHLADNMREETLANRFHYSTAYFSRAFHQCVGMSFRDYVCRKRLALAKRLLIEEPKTKIVAISYQCGYRDLSYFNRIFKKKNGMSPGMYRQTLIRRFSRQSIR